MQLLILCALYLFVGSLATIVQNNNINIMNINQELLLTANYSSVTSSFELPMYVTTLNIQMYCVYTLFILLL